MRRIHIRTCHVFPEVATALEGDLEPSRTKMKTYPLLDPFTKSVRVGGREETLYPVIIKDNTLPLSSRTMSTGNLLRPESPCLFGVTSV